MANYTPTFTKPYPSGWVDKPSKTTPATAAIMNSYDTAIAALESYLRDNAIDTVTVSAEQFPSDGRQWIGTITVGSNQYRIYMPSLKYENSVSDGIKIGTITLGEQSFDVYAPSSSAGGSTVSVVPKTLTGTNIAEITVDGTTYQLYAPTSGGGSGSTVTAEATLTEGTQIGKITIDGTETILYAPTASAITVDAELSATSENPVQNKVVKAEFDKVDSNLTNLKVSDVAGGKNLLNKNKFVPNITIAKDGSIIKDDVYNLIYVPIKANIDYVFSRLTDSSGSAGVVWGISNLFPSEGGTSSYNPLYSKSNKFNVKSNTDGYFLIRDRFDMHEDGTGSNWQLEEGTQATDYEPYIPSVKMLAEENAQQSTDLSNIKNGTTTVAKASADEDGNNIKSTYATKAEIPSAPSFLCETVNVDIITDLFEKSITQNYISCERVGNICTLSFWLQATANVNYKNRHELFDIDKIPKNNLTIGFCVVNFNGSVSNSANDAYNYINSISVEQYYNSILKRNISRVYLLPYHTDHVVMSSGNDFIGQISWVVEA